MADTRKSARSGNGAGKARKTRAASRQDRTLGVQLATAAGAAVALGATALAVWFGRRKGAALFGRATNPAEHAVPDLAADAPVPGTNRAPDAFRPDPTAPVPPELRESLRPATGPAPSLAADRGTTIQ